MPDELSLSERCRELLEERWNRVCAAFVESRASDPLNAKHSRLRASIWECLRSKTKSYRYVLPTQILSKAVEQSLDCRSLQASSKAPGAFDARTVAHKVVVPFDQANHDVLGGSREPYVNNPLRCKSVSPEYRSRQKDKDGWDRLIEVLDAVEEANQNKFTLAVLDQILHCIYFLLDEVSVSYPTPNRISLQQTLEVINRFAQIRSGGDIMEALVTAFLQTAGSQFNLYDAIMRESVNATDTSSGMLADIECYKENKIVLLAEVKDRTLTLTELQARIEIARANNVAELLFVAQDGAEAQNRQEILQIIEREFNSGINIYLTNLTDLTAGSLALLGEHGRVEFVRRIGLQLEAGKTAIVHRKEWAHILRGV